MRPEPTDLIVGSCRDTATMSAAMVRRLKLDLRLLGEQFPEHQVEPIRVTGLT
jgi:hypothetical protein